MNIVRGRLASERKIDVDERDVESMVWEYGVVIAGQEIGLENDIAQNYERGGLHSEQSMILS